MTTKISGSTGIELGGGGIQFVDETEQATAGVPNNAVVFAGDTASGTFPTDAYTACNVVPIVGAEYWNSTTREFTPTQAGWYLVGATLTFHLATVGGAEFIAAIHKNGVETLWATSLIPTSASRGSISTQGLIHLNGSTDKIKFMGYVTTTTGTPSLNGSRSNVFAHLIRETS